MDLGPYFSRCGACLLTKPNYLFAPSQLRGTLGGRTCIKCLSDKGKRSRKIHSPPAKETWLDGIGLASVKQFRRTPKNLR